MKKEERHLKGKMGKKNIISNLILVIAIFIFIYSAYMLIGIYLEYRGGDKEYNHIAEEVIEVPTLEEQVPEEEATQENTKHISLKVDFHKLQKVNKDAVGWIQFDEPKKISYPIVKGKDNDQYLKTTFEGKTNSAGSIFMDANNSWDFTDSNTFIYGHNMKNGSMFGQLRKFKAKDYYEQNPYFYIYTPEGEEVKYQIFAVCIVEDTSRSYTRHFNNDADFLEYLNHIKSIALYDTGVEVTAESSIVSLSTCTNVTETQRLLVHGVKMSKTVAED